MYIIIVHRAYDSYPEYFGPFQTESRAKQYGKEMPEEWIWSIVPITVPNCIGVSFTTKY